MANIPQEIITEILTRVPAKSLLQFRCVSKPWCNLISADSSFIKTHLIRAVERNNVDLFLLGKDQHIYSVEGDTLNESMEIKNPFDGFLIHGSCNSIVCLRKENKICLMNPSTREYKILEIDHRVYLLNFPRVYGFGYDDTTEDFKLVEIVYFNLFKFYSQIFVYSFKHDSWSTISDIPYWKVYPKELGIYLHGSLHWIAYTVEPNCSKRIVCFNVKENVVQEMFGPVALNSSAVTKLGVFEGQLCVLCTSNYIAVWVIKDYGLSDSWYKLFSIDKPFQSSVGRQMGVFCFSTKGKILLKNDSKIVIYDPKRKAMTAEACDVPWLKIVPYVASLVSLNKGSYPRVKESSIGQFCRVKIWKK